MGGRTGESSGRMGWGVSGIVRRDLRPSSLKSKTGGELDHESQIFSIALLILLAETVGFEPTIGFPL
jgi:hypothetical protein